MEQPSDSASPLDATVQTFLTRFYELVDEWSEAGRDITAAQSLIEERTARQNQIRSDVDQLKAAGEVLGFNLYAEHERRKAGQSPSETAAAPDSGAADEMSAPLPPPLKIKDWVLQAAKDAFPDPVRAATLRKRLRDQGHDIHDKTIGMTLYRLTKPPLKAIRRDGYDWYYVPDTSTAEGREIEGRTF